MLVTGYLSCIICDDSNAQIRACDPSRIRDSPIIPSRRRAPLSCPTSTGSSGGLTSIDDHASCLNTILVPSFANGLCKGVAVALRGRRMTVDISPDITALSRGWSIISKRARFGYSAVDVAGSITLCGAAAHNKWFSVAIITKAADTTVPSPIL